MRLLNLFSGTGSVSKPWRAAGHEVFDVDVDPRFSPEHCGDILQWDYTKLPFMPDVIWSSPPCDQYSRARTTGGPRNLKLADSLVARALEIIQFFQEKNPDLIWFLENGDSISLWAREIAKDLIDFAVLDYCQYGMPYPKNDILSRETFSCSYSPEKLLNATAQSSVGYDAKPNANRQPTAIV